VLGQKLARWLLGCLAVLWVVFWAALAGGQVAGATFGLLVFLPIWVCFVLMNVLLVLDSIVAGARKQGWSRLLVAAVLLVLALPQTQLRSGLTWLAAAIRLRLHEREYEEEARAVLALPESQMPESPWERDGGPPRRAALVFGGITDNWLGLVYDPSQTMEDAPEKVFGGDLVCSTHLWGPWYLVDFT
jgi:uncharacterized membrane protein